MARRDRAHGRRPHPRHARAVRGGLERDLLSASRCGGRRVARGLRRVARLSRPTPSPSGTMTRGAIARLLGDDHARLAGLLARAAADPAAYAAFRRGLLRHIAMEEKILLPTAQRARGGKPLPLAGRLRLDHGALAALL